MTLSLKKSSEIEIEFDIFLTQSFYRIKCNLYLRLYVFFFDHIKHLNKHRKGILFLGLSFPFTPLEILLFFVMYWGFFIFLKYFLFTWACLWEKRSLVSSCLPKDLVFGCRCWRSIRFKLCLQNIFLSDIARLPKQCTSDKPRSIKTSYIFRQDLHTDIFLQHL